MILNISETAINRSTSWTSHAHKTVKKLIAYQSAGLYGNSLASQLASMHATLPEYSGVAFRLGTDSGSNKKYAFESSRWTDTQTGLANLGAVKTASLATYKDNFIVVWGGSPTGHDFFNNALWTEIKYSAEALSRAINASGAKGIFFDPEHYTGGTTYSPWSYSLPSNGFTPPYVAQGKTFAQVKEQARIRGKEWMRRVQALTPDIVVNSTFLWSGVWTKIGKNINNLENSIYALLPSFLDGMLDELAVGGTIVDGREGQFYVDETRKYLEPDTVISGDDREYTFTRFEASRALLPSTRWEKFDKQVEVGGVAWTDYCFNDTTDQPNRSWGGANYGNYWYEHNLYNTLLTSDSYSWSYNWLNPWTASTSQTGGDFKKALKSAVTKIQSLERLGFDMCKQNNIYKLNLDKPATFIRSFSGALVKTASNKVFIQMPIDKTVTSVALFVNNRRHEIFITTDTEITFQGDGRDYTVVARFTLADGNHRLTNPVIITA